MIIDLEFIWFGVFLKVLVESVLSIEMELCYGISGQVLEGLKCNELDVGFFFGDICDFDLLVGFGLGVEESFFYVLELVLLIYCVVVLGVFVFYVCDRIWVELVVLFWIGMLLVLVYNCLFGCIFGELGVWQNVVVLIDQEMFMFVMVCVGVGLSFCWELIVLYEQQLNGFIIVNLVKIEIVFSFILLKVCVNDFVVVYVFDVVWCIWEQNGQFD